MNVWNTFNQVNDLFDDLTDDKLSVELDYKKDLLIEEKCFNCKGINILHVNGKKLCPSCGFVNGEILDMQQEWRYYGADDNKRSSDPTRCGMPTSSLFSNNAFGAVMMGYGNEKYRRLLKWNSIQYKAKSLMAVFKYIQEVCIEAKIPYCVSDKAKLMYKIVSENNIKRGVSRHSLIAACVYFACKDRGIERKRREISNMFEIGIKRMTTGCNMFKEIMFNKNPDFVNGLNPSSTEDFIRRNCVLLKISGEQREKMIYVANIAELLGIIMDNIPSSIAVGSIYLVSQENKLNISKKKIAETCGTSHVIVAKTYKILKKWKKYLISYNLEKKKSKEI